MRALIQRVSQASVSIEGSIKSEIEKGLLVLLGIEEDDDPTDIEWLANKIISMRIFGDDDGKMNLSLQDIDGELLVVSQFTLHAKTKKGNRPSFTRAAHPDRAIPLYEDFIHHCENLMEGKVQSGEFGADMKVGLINDGPVTIMMDSKNRE